MGEAVEVNQVSTENIGENSEVVESYFFFKRLEEVKWKNILRGNEGTDNGTEKWKGGKGRFTEEVVNKGNALEWLSMWLALMFERLIFQLSAVEVKARYKVLTSEA